MPVKKKKAKPVLDADSYKKVKSKTLRTVDSQEGFHYSLYYDLADGSVVLEDAESEDMVAKIERVLKEKDERIQELLGKEGWADGKIRALDMQIENLLLQVKMRKEEVEGLKETLKRMHDLMWQGEEESAKVLKLM